MFANANASRGETAAKSRHRKETVRYGDKSPGESHGHIYDIKVNPAKTIAGLFFIRIISGIY